MNCIYQYKIGKSVIALFFSLVITLPINLLSQNAGVKENKTIKPIKFNGGINLSTSIFNGTGNKVWLIARIIAPFLIHLSDMVSVPNTNH